MFRIREVFWAIDNNLFTMARVRPIELAAARKQRPGLMGVPRMYAILIDGDVDWFPDSMRGEPVVVLEP
jgi:hypothetical protein